MRAGVCTVQQALTAEAASMVKQALGLARRRGHAQVTPLHVASAMLATSTGLLRRACLQSHSHPLQFRALELCFNVALNRLHASTSSPLLGPHHHHPSLSNALVAAFKRAQAHQRRGSIENQQQPILALKIELEHLILSILDDPSVSRVMREAGFSSTQVKIEVEQTVSMEISSQTPSPKESNPNPQALGANPNGQTQYGFGFSSSKQLDRVRNDRDVTNVLSTMMNRKGNTVIIGESVAVAESVVRGVVDKFEKMQVSGDLRYLQLISLPLFSLKNLDKDEVEQKLVELKCLVKSYMGRGVVLFLGDLKWISEFWSSYGDQRRNYSCPVEHIVMELKRLASGKLFLMGIATFKTYMKCKLGHPSLESIWELYPFTISADSLSLGLNLESCDAHSQYEAKESIDSVTWPVSEAEINKNHSSFTDRLFNFDNVVSSSSSLPSWLQSYKEETRTNSSHDNKEANWPVIFESKKSPKELQFWISENDPKPELLSNPNSSPNSASSSEAIEEDIDGINAFKDLNAENINILCNALEKQVPWQKDVVPEIVSTILECRSGTREGKSWLNQRELKEETWLFFLGSDNEAKQKIARELARLVFGSQTSFASISLSDFGSKRADSIEDNKRKRSDESGNIDHVLQRFGEALNENPHRVFFVEDMEHVDCGCLKRIKQAIETGKVTISDGVTVPVMDSIVIFSCESFSSMSRACSSRRRPNRSDPEEMKGTETEQDEKQSVSLDLNIAIGDNSKESDHEIGILKCVDNQIVFKEQNRGRRW
ncbi:exocyst complex component EXO70A1-like [Hibiscus syriacus]|uniref:Exocyst complex component EXO70A1-like n=1 Tax=Hibiscus syriacus TaxID=106335 RepID=A0A6A2YA65_HIBSY|nr:protein SMAX1-LIKE 3-like [Hibiscus syriacus]KAE8679325.1 exocyst complex component EXO70A1-like [Hibiscus syriacus]